MISERRLAALLVAHELHIAQAVKPFRTLYRCGTCGHEVDAMTVRHSDAQAAHQAQTIRATR